MKTDSVNSKGSQIFLVRQIGALIHSLVKKVFSVEAPSLNFRHIKFMQKLQQSSFSVTERVQIIMEIVITINNK